MSEIAGRINPMVALCRRVAWLAAVEGNKTRGGPGAGPMTDLRRLHVYEQHSGHMHLTPAQRRRMYQKRSKHLTYAWGSRPADMGDSGLPVFDATTRKRRFVPEPTPSWERKTTLLPLVDVSAEPALVGA